MVPGSYLNGTRQKLSDDDALIFVLNIHISDILCCTEVPHVVTRLIPHSERRISYFR